ncbi:REX4, RNA exonuclease 4 [Saguinus oedipus]|uniref:REX4, RNA exonuclease 4 n=1 Tax=Saguinus oedipus TaxID=9490 RepID=A0ABQ9WGH6_SAGOE|nr:REX4, RNA exonuclease 4 [Saguinus oedipus]
MRRPGFQPVAERQALPGTGACAPRCTGRVRGLFRGHFPGRVPAAGVSLVWAGACAARAGLGWLPAEGLDHIRMVKAKVPTSKRAPSSPVAKPGPVSTLTRKKNKKKKGVWKSKAQEGSRKPGSGPGVVVRPPKAPEDFSQNWKALQEVRLEGAWAEPGEAPRAAGSIPQNATEGKTWVAPKRTCGGTFESKSCKQPFTRKWLLKQKSQAPEKPLVISQISSKKKPKIIQQNKKETSPQVNGEEMPAGKDPEASEGSVPLGSSMDRKALVPHTKASGAEHSKKGTKERTNGNTGPERGDIKHKKRKAKEAAPAPPTEEDIWFDDVDPADIEAAIGPEAAKIVRKRLGLSSSSLSLVKEQAFSGLTRALALDCEMVGVGPKGEENVAARVSIVNQYGKCVYDKYVKPTELVTDYRTAVSGIRPENLKQGA